MLPFFCATEHFPCGKSAQLCLEDMLAFKNKMDRTEYEKFSHKDYSGSRIKLDLKSLKLIESDNVRTFINIANVISGTK